MSLSNTTIFRSEHGYYSNADAAQKGLILAASLHASDDPVDRALLRLCSPAGVSSALAILRVNQANLASMWLRGPETNDGLGRVWLPNPLIDEEPITQREVLRLLTDDKALAELLCDLDPRLKPPAHSVPWRTFAMYVEAILPDDCEPLLRGLAAGDGAGCWPIEIDLDWQTGRPFTRRRARRPVATQYYPKFVAAFAQLTAQLAAPTPEFKPTFEISEAVRQIDQLAVQILERLGTGDRGRANVIASDLRVLQEVPWVLRHMSGGDFPQEISPNQHRCVRRIRDSGLAAHLLARCPEALTARAVSRPIESMLIGMDPFEQRFNLWTYPSLHDVRAAALRMVMILEYECCRRTICLSEVTPRCFFGEGPETEVILPRTKVRGMNNASCPLGAVASTRSIKFANDWAAACVGRGLGDHRLLELALGTSLPNAGPKLWSVLANEIRIVFSLPELPNLHDFRRCSISWLVVRMMVALEPSLRSHRVLESSVCSPLFAADALQRLQRYLENALPIDDPIELIAGIAGNSLPTEIRQTYIRTWPILLALRCQSIWQQLGLRSGRHGR